MHGRARMIRQNQKPPADEDIGYEAPVPASYLPRDREMQITMHEPESLLPGWAVWAGVAVMALLAAWAVMP